jgi:hypothetical protein
MMMKMRIAETKMWTTARQTKRKYSKIQVANC